MAWWLKKNNLLILGTAGKQPGLRSDSVGKVLTRRWITDSAGPKTQNFVKNLLGTGHEATIDVWADRLLRRLGYEGYVDRWRIEPKYAAPISAADFDFGQKVFRKAADDVGMSPDDLQAALWFTEKKHWADKGWSRNLDLGDFRTEIQRTELYRRGFAEGKGPGQVRVEERKAAAKAEKEKRKRRLDFLEKVK